VGATGSRLRAVGAATLATAALAAGGARATSPGPDVRLDLASASSSASLGHYVAYRATVSNLAKNTVTHAALTAPLATSTSPFPLAYVSATSSVGSCSPPPGLPVTCSFGSLRSGEVVTVDFLFRVPASLPATGSSVSFGADVSFDEGPNDQNKSHGDTLATAAAIALAPAGNDFVTGFVPFALGDTLATAGSLQGDSKANPQSTSVLVAAGSAGGFGAVGVVNEVAHTATDTSSDCQAGFSCFGQTSFVTMPGLFSATPLKLSFRFDSSELPKWTSAAKLRMFHDGQLVPRCTTPGVLSPAPTCQSSTTTFGDKDLGAVVLSSSNGSYRP
jgi:hypothetical protein